jgi:hypothetical protein
VIPFFLPAWLMSWHGKPAEMVSKSWSWASAAQSVLVKSPRFTAHGKRAAMTWAAYLSFSA